MKILFFNPEQYVDFKEEGPCAQARVPILNCGLPISHEDYIYQRVLRQDGREAMNRGAVEVFKSFEPDVVINSQTWPWECVEVSTLIEIQNLGGKVISIFWDTDTGNNYRPERSELILASDLVIIGDSMSICMQHRAWCDSLGRQDNILFAPIFNNGNIFFKENVQKIHDVAFIGSINKWRMEFVEYLEAELSKKGVKFCCTGGNYAIENGSWVTSKNWLSWSEYARTINQSKIGISSQSSPNTSVIKGRPFDYLACGIFCLSDPNPDLKKIVPEGCLAYFDSPEECVHKAMHFLEHEADREEIAQKGHDWFNKFYDSQSFWKSVLNFVVHKEGKLPTVPAYEQEYQKFMTLLPSVSRSHLHLLNKLSNLVNEGNDIKPLSVKLQEIINGHYLFRVDEQHLVISDHSEIDFMEINGKLHAQSPQFGLFKMDDSTLFTSNAQIIMSVPTEKHVHQAVAMIMGQKSGAIG